MSVLKELMLQAYSSAALQKIELAVYIVVRINSLAGTLSSSFLAEVAVAEPRTEVRACAAAATFHSEAELYNRSAQGDICPVVGTQVLIRKLNFLPVCPLQ